MVSLHAGDTALVKKATGPRLDLFWAFGTGLRLFGETLLLFSLVDPTLGVSDLSAEVHRHAGYEARSFQKGEDSPSHPPSLPGLAWPWQGWMRKCPLGSRA
jgi:hypothetical protein